MSPLGNKRGQSIIEYILVVAVIAFIIAAIIRGTTRTLYEFWSGLATQVSSGCANCQKTPAPPL